MGKQFCGVAISSAVSALSEVFTSVQPTGVLLGLHTRELAEQVSCKATAVLRP